MKVFLTSLAVAACAAAAAVAGGPGRHAAGAAAPPAACVAAVPATRSGPANPAGRAAGYPVTPVPFTRVRFQDGFWLPRLETNRAVTIPYDFKKCEETGRIDNFLKAAGRMKGPHRGYRFNDSDVFKVIEGASYSLALDPDPKLEAYLDGLIAKIAAAQEKDGYLYTLRTIDPDHVPPAAGPKRWSNLRDSHELYNAGHMYEAAVAYFRAAGKGTFLDVAEKNADLVARVFGPAGRHDVPGHEEIEIGLAKLSLATGRKKYLDLAKFFLDERGRAHGRALYGSYCQDHEPVTEQTEAVGHAVRAGYLYSAMADVAALTGDKAYIEAIDRIWENVVSRKLYITGGIGARAAGEAFGDDFELPNGTAYCETCAAVANALWNRRLFLLHGDGKYIDVLERIIYNGFLSGVSLDGNSFFYANPLSSAGGRKRSPWFGCSCCPTNVVRFLPSLPGFVYAKRGRTLFVNLFVAGSAEIDLDGLAVKVEQKTRYPWEGAVKINLAPKKPAKFEVRLRVPGWALGRPVPSGLYRYIDKASPKAMPRLAVNGEEMPLAMDKGFACLDRTWQGGDTIELDLPMAIRRVAADDRVAADRGRVALERGPLVFCAEGVDNQGRTDNIVLPDAAALEASFRKDLLHGVEVITGEARALFRDEEGKVAAKDQPFTAIPYYAWAHRGAGPMDVWLPREDGVARPLPPETIASRSRVAASHRWSGDTTSALNDRLEPKGSGDHAIPRFTWWDHRGTTEWVEYDFPGPARVSSAAVYWFDDTGRGQCRVPESWRLLYKAGAAWKPVAAGGPYGVAKDRFNEVSFEPVETAALRLEAKLRPEFSGGILEWTVK